MFLHSQRPEHGGTVRHSDMKQGSEVRTKDGTQQQIASVLVVEQRPHQDDGEIQRHDAQEPSRIEVPEIVGAASSVEQDSRNEEPGQHEKQVDAKPAMSNGYDHRPWQKTKCSLRSR